MIGDAWSSCLEMTLNAVLIGVILSDFELGHSRRWLYTKQPQEDCTECIKRSISRITLALFLIKKNHGYILPLSTHAFTTA